MSYLVQFVLGLFNIGLGLFKTDKPMQNVVKPSGNASLPTKTDDELASSLGLKRASGDDAGKV